jgi:hypothetical protein
VVEGKTGRGNSKSSKGSAAKVLLAVGLVIVVLLGVAAVVGWNMLPGLVLAEVVRQADKRGVQLRGCEIELAWDLPKLSGVTLKQCEFELARAPYVTGKLDEIEVELVDMKPKTATVSGADIVVRGTPKLSDILEDRKPSLDDIRVKVRESRLRWFATESETPRLDLAALRYDSDGGEFASQVEIEGILRGTASRRASVIETELHLVDNPKAKLSARLEQDTSLGEVRTEFEKLALSELDGPLLPIPKELHHVQVDARFYAQIPLGMSMKQPKGDLRLTLHGLNFPVPRELEGLVYGTPAELSTQFTLDRSLTRAKLRRLQFSVGALQMNGDGKVELEGDGLAFELAMAGNLSCSAIVRSATAAHAGSEIAKVAGKIAKKALKGSVKIIVFVDGHTDSLEQTKVIKSVGVGCGLRPELVDELAQLPTRLLEQLPDIPGLGRLPKPDERPKIGLPKLPDFPFPGKKRIHDPDAPPESSKGEQAAPQQPKEAK